MKSRTIVRCALAATIGVAAAHQCASILLACGGTPPEPFCSHSVSKIISVPRNIAYDGLGQLVEIHYGVFITQTSFPTPDICPPGDFILTGEFTLTCPAGAPFTTTVGPTIVSEGLNSLTTLVFVPPGLTAPSICTLTGFVDIAFPNGSVLRAECASELCLTEPSAPGSTVPRLSAELVNDPIVSPIQAIHPGDPTGQVWRITNNDATHAFDGVVTGRSMNNSRMPIEIASGGPGSGPFAVSDPVAGDNFPIEFFDPGSLPYDGWVYRCADLSASPHDPAVPETSLPLALAPGESIDIGLTVRPWGVCASGSGCRVPLEVSGLFEDGTNGFACVNGVAYADSSVPPRFECDDGGSGSVGQFFPGKLPDSLIHFCDPGIDPYVIYFQVEIVELNLESIAPIEITPQSGSLTPDYGRVQHTISSADPDLPLLPPGSEPVVGVTFRHRSTASLGDLVVSFDSFMLLPEIPIGFELTAPVFKGTLRASSPDWAQDSFFDVLIQLSGVRVCDDGLLCSVPMEFELDSITLNDDGEVLTSGVWRWPLPATRGFATERLELRADVRGFAYLGAAPPCPWDLSGSGSVGSADLANLLGCWGPVAPGDPCAAADFTNSGSVGSADLATLLGKWGPCP